MRRLPGSRPVRAPAADLPPQSFGRNHTWQVWFLFFTVVTSLAEALMVLRWVFVLNGRFAPGDFLFPLVVYGVVATLAMNSPGTRLAGGDGWLMLLQGRWPQAWVRTSWLVHISLESRYEGEGDYAPHLTLRDGEGRELGTWLRKLTAEAAASLLEGIRRSSGAELADLSSPDAQAAVTALGELAQGRPAAALTAESG